MRFCPFCSAENADEATHCATCARRLPPLPPRRQNKRAEGDRTAAAGSAEPSLASVSPGPAARRREAPSPELRRTDQPARRATDVVDEQPAGHGRTMPPPPSRAERDRLASERASRPLTPDARPPRFASPSEPGASRRPTSESERPPSKTPIPRAATPTPVPGKDEDDEWPAPARGQTRRESSPPGAAAEPPAPAGDEPRPESSADGAAPAPARDQAGAESPPSRPSARAPREPERRPDTAEVPSPAELARTPARPRRRHTSDPAAPPPTRVSSTSAAVRDGAFKPPPVSPVPSVPEPGLINSARYALSFARARWQRRSVIKELDDEIREDTAALDGVLGTLGQQAREHEVDNRVLADENAAIDAAETRRARIEHECSELSNRQAEENSRFAETESEREAKVRESETELEAAQRDLQSLEAQRRGLRDKRKQIERQQKGYLKAAEERDEQAAKAAMGDQRASLRRAAEDLRRDAAGLDPERQEIERKLGGLEKPISQAMAKVEALKAELDSARRSLNDAREGHRHRLAELEAEQGRKSRELAQSESEIQRRMVTLGTLVNLHRIDRPEFRDLYESIDRLRAAIGARSTEIDRLTAEREAYDKGSLVRGFVVLAGGVVFLVTLVVILLAVS